MRRDTKRTRSVLATHRAGVPAAGHDVVTAATAVVHLEQEVELEVHVGALELDHPVAEGAVQTRLHSSLDAVPPGQLDDDGVAVVLGDGPLGDLNRLVRGVVVDQNDLVQLEVLLQEGRQGGDETLHR